MHIHPQHSPAAEARSSAFGSDTQPCRPELLDSLDTLDTRDARRARHARQLTATTCIHNKRLLGLRQPAVQIVQTRHEPSRRAATGTGATNVPNSQLLILSPPAGGGAARSRRTWTSTEDDTRRSSRGSSWRPRQTRVTDASSTPATGAGATNVPEPQLLVLSPPGVGRGPAFGASGRTLRHPGRRRTHTHTQHIADSRWCYGSSHALLFHAAPTRSQQGGVLDAHAKLCHVPRGSQILEWVVVHAL